MKVYKWIVILIDNNWNIIYNKKWPPFILTIAISTEVYDFFVPSFLELHQVFLRSDIFEHGMRETSLSKLGHIAKSIGFINGNMVAKINWPKKKCQEKSLENILRQTGRV